MTSALALALALASTGLRATAEMLDTAADGLGWAMRRVL